MSVLKLTFNYVLLSDFYTSVGEDAKDDCYQLRILFEFPQQYLKTEYRGAC